MKNKKTLLLLGVAAAALYFINKNKNTNKSTSSVLNTNPKLKLVAPPVLKPVQMSGTNIY